MRVRIWLVAAFLGVSAACPAQMPGFSVPQVQFPWEQSRDFFQSAWKRVKAEGPAAAEKIVRATPEAFKRVRQETDRLSKRTQKWSEERGLEERKNLLIELWRVRGSLDLMAMLNPDTLEHLTGIDAKTLRGMRGQVERAMKDLGPTAGKQ